MHAMEKLIHHIVVTVLHKGMTIAAALKAAIVKGMYERTSSSIYAMLVTASHTRMMKSLVRRARDIQQ